ncbi:MAG: transposase [Methanohalophilus sp. T328-1]|nr:MAG: transposase [Methanohalophilus sp. T328-1]
MSLVDKDARHGSKSDSKPFTGYKGNVMKSDDGSGTNIIVTAGNTYDENVILPIVDENIK